MRNLLDEDGLVPAGTITKIRNSLHPDALQAHYLLARRRGDEKMTASVMGNIHSLIGKIRTLQESVPLDVHVCVQEHAQWLRNEKQLGDQFLQGEWQEFCNYTGRMPTREEIDDLTCIAKGRAMIEWLSDAFPIIDRAVRQRESKQS
jgi:hypothetical protein